MTTPAQPAASPPARPTKTAVTWRARDLVSHAGQWGVSRAVVRAALRNSGKESVGSPDEAEKLIRDFLKQDLTKLEADAVAARKKGSK